MNYAALPNGTAAEVCDLTCPPPSTQDTYDVDQDTAQRYQAYYSPNIWPGDHLPQLESSFKQLGSLIIRAGLQLAGHCSK